MRTVLLGLLLAANYPCLLRAAEHLPLSRLLWIFPPGAKAGTTREVVISGTDLDEPSALLFSDSRMTGRLKTGTTDHFEVTVPNEVPDGIVDVRFAGRFGLSNPRSFAVHRGEEMTSPGNNTSPSAASPLPRNVLVYGRVQAGAAHWFRFDASGGERIFAEMMTHELDSRLVPDLAIFSSDGREIKQVRRHPFLDFSVPTNGSYLLRLNDQIFAGGDQYAHRLIIHSGPHLDFAVPNVLVRGATNSVTLYGRNLGGEPIQTIRGWDGTPLEKRQIDIPPDAISSAGVPPSEYLQLPASAALALDSVIWRYPGTNGISNPILFTLSTLPVILLRPTNLTDIAPPCELSGIFPTRVQKMGARFKATKGDVLRLEVAAHRLGQSCSPHGLIQREQIHPNSETNFSDMADFGEKDANVGDREFNTGTHDISYRFDVPETGTYRILIRDLFNPGEHQPHLPFRMSVRHEDPDFQIVAFTMPPTRIGDDRTIPLTPITLRRGETGALKVVALRRDGFSGEIELSVPHPPPGIVASQGRIRSGETTGTLLLTASEQAKERGSLVVESQARIGDKMIQHPVLFSCTVWPVADYNNESATTRLCREGTISIINAETAPVVVAIGDGKPVDVSDDGKFTLPIHITRHDDFMAAFNLKPSGFPGLDKVREVNVPEKGTNAIVEWNNAEVHLPTGTHQLWLQGTVTGKYRNNPAALAAAEQELKAAEQALHAATSDGKAKAEERIKAAEIARKAADERAKPKEVTVAVWSQPFVVKVLPKINAAEGKK